MKYNYLYETNNLVNDAINNLSEELDSGKKKKMLAYLEKKFLPSLVKAAKKNKVPTFLPWRFEVVGEEDDRLNITFEVGAGKGFIDFLANGNFSNKDGKEVPAKKMIDELIGAGQVWRSRASDEEKEDEDARNSIPFKSQV